MEYEDDPNIAKTIKALKTAGVYFIDECQPSTRVFHKTTLTWCSKFLTEARLKKTDWLDIVCLLLVIEIWSKRILTDFLICFVFVRDFTLADTHGDSVHELVIQQMDVDEAIES